MSIAARIKLATECQTGVGLCEQRVCVFGQLSVAFPLLFNA
ncbi:MAG: hypothetical protein ACR2MA_10950 [Egibacteraceae bacterium]